MSLRYRTNGPDFDFPRYDGLPPVRYVLAATPRCGSSMLARALWHTGTAGFAEGYFADAHVLDYFERWGFASDDDELLIKGYIQNLMRFRTSPNGVFGVKVHPWNLTELEVDLHEALSSPRYIWIQRRDHVRQAISYVLAKQTGVWILDGRYLPMGHAVSDPRYSYEEIRHHVRLLEQQSMVLEDYFDHRGLTPHVVVYEDLLANYEANVLGCLRSLGVDPPERIPEPGIRRQANELTEQWVEMFERDTRRVHSGSSSRPTAPTASH